MSILVLIADVAGMIKAVGVDRPCRLFRVVEVTLHHVSSAYQYLAVRLRNFHLDAFERHPDRSDLIIVRTIGRHYTSLGHSVALQNRDTGCPKRVRQFL